ncbi:NAD(P)/FAD-dependent oxidoreductase [Lignipirellula cremea]|uniref:Gamma-glutamylputrescine oxidoreductase n=1 Tax=Lignipirellula cremea TaxID=2528010 RepID=A0A518DST2_9BACT|nr:FAD-dependent oxidoreductase [Lignipirellula cremea]QDU94901.1 Gamma-glutamylputrescine oxidoreductase [Lignipirellula cremea]
MDLTSEHPFWLVKNGLLTSYPPLMQDESCDVAVIGAGITGAMLAERLSRIGMSVAVVDRRDVCQGSTSASTALLQYEIDLPLVEMAKKIGRAAAERAYRLSYASIDSLESLAQRLPVDCGFERKLSLYRASDPPQARLLAEEAEARLACDIPVEFLGPDELREKYHLPGTAALLSHQAAACDPYRFAHLLLAESQRQGARIYDRTCVTRYDCSGQGVRLETDRGFSISTGQVVVATGYEAQQMLSEKVVDLQSTYAIVSQPLRSLSPWNNRWMMWEANDPYLYLRITPDNRLLAGGEDDPFRNPAARDASLPAKAERIAQKVRELLPSLEWETEFSWAGTFGKTSDGLAYIGPTDEYPHCYFALGYGGNGITFSAIAVDLLSDLLQGRPNADASLFRFGR